MERGADLASHMSSAGHQVEVEERQKARDLGALLGAEFKPSVQFQMTAKNDWFALGQLRGIAVSKSPEDLLPLLKAFVRLRSDYCIQAWRPYLVGGVKMLEQVQRVLHAGLESWCTGVMSRL